MCFDIREGEDAKRLRSEIRLLPIQIILISPRISHSWRWLMIITLWHLRFVRILKILSQKNQWSCLIWRMWVIFLYLLLGIINLKKFPRKQNPILVLTAHQWNLILTVQSKRKAGFSKAKIKYYRLLILRLKYEQSICEIKLQGSWITIKIRLLWEAVKRCLTSLETENTVATAVNPNRWKTSSAGQLKVGFINFSLKRKYRISVLQIQITLVLWPLQSYASFTERMRI